MIETNDPSGTGPRGSRVSKWRVSLVVFGVAVLVAGGAGLYWFFGGDAPAAVDLSATASAVQSEGSSGSGNTATGIAGTWAVDTGIGDFTVDEDSTATFVGFRVDEVLSGIGSNTAIGRAPVVAGEIVIDDAMLTAAEITVDLTSLVSDESRRDNAIQEALNTSDNPTAAFVLTDPVELRDGAGDGEGVEAIAVGELTVNGITNEVEVPLTASLVDGKVLVTGSTDIVFADYDVTAPSAPIVVSVEDRGILEVQIWLSRPA